MKRQEIFWKIENINKYYIKDYFTLPWIDEEKLLSLPEGITSSHILNFLKIIKKNKNWKPHWITICPNIEKTNFLPIILSVIDSLFNWSTAPVLILNKIT